MYLHINIESYHYKRDYNPDLLEWAFSRHYHKVKESFIVKVISECDTFYVVELPEARQVNLGFGPTIESTVVTLVKEGFVFPYSEFMTQDYFVNTPEHMKVLHWEESTLDDID